MTSEPAGKLAENICWLEARKATLTADGHKEVPRDQREEEQGRELDSDGVSLQEKPASENAQTSTLPPARSPSLGSKVDRLQLHSHY